MGTVIIIVVLAVIVIFALRGSRKHFAGGGGCCGGGGEIEEIKKLDGKKLGEKIVRIDGMHCENCKNRVERAINRIDGAAARVNLRKKEAVVEYDRSVSDEAIRRAVEDEDYKVVSIEDHPAA